jgi:predicted dehydrogenase
MHHDEQSRREFLRNAMVLGASLPAACRLVRAADAPAPKPKAPSEKLNLGIVGVAGRGGENLNSVTSENIVALCDVDRQRLDPVARAFPAAMACDDYRKLLDVKGLDAVVVSTPDHMHAIVGAHALKAGLDVYCEKPLAHSIHEVRTLRRLAAEGKRVTQMGTQIHAGDNYRRAVEIVQAGTIGPVRRVHVWQSSRPEGGRRAKDGSPPPNVNYDVWLGPAPFRPFDPSHFHFVWRWWWDFGGGVLADMGCHYIDLAYWALGLDAPVSAEATGKKEYEGDNDVPSVMRVDYHYPARGDRPPVHLTWYHGGWMPEGAEVYKKSSAVLFEGDQGKLLADYGDRRAFIGDVSGKSVDLAAPPPSIPASIGHHREWIEAVKSRGTPTCNFDYSGALAEAVLLGNVAYRTGKKIEWDSKELKAVNAPDAAQYVQREYRKGWSL